jgi:hypothetical protein
MTEQRRAQLERSLVLAEWFIALAHECAAMALQMNEPDHVALYEEEARAGRATPRPGSGHLARLPRA